MTIVSGWVHLRVRQSLFMCFYTALWIRSSRCRLRLPCRPEVPGSRSSSPFSSDGVFYGRDTDPERPSRVFFRHRRLRLRCVRFGADPVFSLRESVDSSPFIDFAHGQGFPAGSSPWHHPSGVCFCHKSCCTGVSSFGSREFLPSFTSQGFAFA